MKCRIADFNVEIFFNHPFLSEQCREYAYDFETADLNVRIDREFVKEELERSPVESNEESYEFMLAYRVFADMLPTRGAFVLHSAVFDVDGVGVAFAAQSGTGKTTHMLRWKSLLGERLTVVNGDKPTVRFFEDEPYTPYAYGTPWNGKEHYGCNMRTPIKHLCFIKRGEENRAEPLDQSEAISLIFNQAYMPSVPEQAAATIKLIDRLLKSCKIWTIYCNTDDTAAEKPYKTVFENQK